MTKPAKARDIQAGCAQHLAAVFLLALLLCATPDARTRLRRRA